jgi:uncharacterized iron-regulated protein
MRPRTRLALLAALAAACAPRVDPRLVLQPVAGRTWVSTLDRKHPLVGKIWDGRAGRFVDEAALADALTGADLVLLGEVHDNPDHHLLQARFVRTVVAAGRRPALALEMLTSDLQPALDVARARTPREPEVLADVWKQGGWPDFDLYRPVLAAGLDAALPLVAANLPRAEVRGLVMKGLDAADPALRRRLESGPALPPEAIQELRAEMKASHCGELPDAMLDPLVLAQRARDATLAARLAGASRERGGILIAGKGHVRTRDVPAWLAIDAPGRKVVSVAFVEVDPGLKAPADYVEEFGKGPFPYDFAIFTPGTAREDPCEKMRERSRAHERKEKDSAAPGAPAPPAPAGAAPPARPAASSRP